MINGITRLDLQRTALVTAPEGRRDRSHHVPPVVAPPRIAHDRRPAAGAAYLAQALTQADGATQQSAANVVAAYGRHAFAELAEPGIEWFPVVTSSVDRRV